MFPVLPMTMLAFESVGVIGLRLMKIACGGPEAVDEACMMINEKVGAAFEAHATFMDGGSTAQVISRYREHVSANVGRLAAARRA